MKVKILAGAVLMLALILGIGAVEYFTRPTESVTEPDYTVKQAEIPVIEKPTPERLLELTNAERAKVGVKPLVLDERLNMSAQRKADELVIEGWDDTPHINNSGTNTAIYAYDAKTECTYVSENLTDNIHTNDSESAINAWMISESHREALLDPDYEYVGFGVEDTKIVQHFCDID